MSKLNISKFPKFFNVFDYFKHHFEQTRHPSFKFCIRNCRNVVSFFICPLSEIFEKCNGSAFLFFFLFFISTSLLMFLFLKHDFSNDLSKHHPISFCVIVFFLFVLYQKHERKAILFFNIPSIYHFWSMICLIWTNTSP